jgi:hypothetical protein
MLSSYRRDVNEIFRTYSEMISFLVVVERLFIEDTEIRIHNLLFENVDIMVLMYYNIGCRKEYFFFKWAIMEVFDG